MSEPQSEATGLNKGLTSYGDPGFSLFLRTNVLKAAGYSDDVLDRRIVGITNTGSDFNPCHANAPLLIDALRRGIMLSGALPMVFPTISIHESFAHPTSMFLRNLMSIDTEEMIRAQPMDTAVVIGGCDKTVPAQLMGSISANVPVIQLVVGPMVPGTVRGVQVGACTDCRKYWGKYRAGEIDIEDIKEAGNELAPSAGTCGVMGTASTMAVLAETLGLAMIGSACAPANSSHRLRIAEATGRLAASGKVPRPSEILTRKSFENAITMLQAIGGSTNAVVHLLAIAGRVGGLDLSLKDFDIISRRVPLVVDLKPSGEFFMDDLHKAGGVPEIMRQIRHLLHLEVMTVSGRTLGEELDARPSSFPQSIVRSVDNPLHPHSSIVVLYGNLAPGGAIIKASAMDPNLRYHRGRACVFKNMDDMMARIDQADLDVDAESVLVLQNIGPVGHPGMPEAGYLPIPEKLLAKGVKDMVRISDGRMSGTAFGAIVLHVSPEAAIGGPLAVIQNGDIVTLDVDSRLIDMDVSQAEITRRQEVWRTENTEVPGSGARGYRGLYARSVEQANLGADFDFLKAK